MATETQKGVAGEVTRTTLAFTGAADPWLWFCVIALEVVWRVLFYFLVFLLVLVELTQGLEGTSHLHLENCILKTIHDTESLKSSKNF